MEELVVVNAGGGLVTAVEAAGLDAAPVAGALEGGAAIGSATTLAVGCGGEVGFIVGAGIRGTPARAECEGAGSPGIALSEDEADADGAAVDVGRTPDDCAGTRNGCWAEAPARALTAEAGSGGSTAGDGGEAGRKASTAPMEMATTSRLAPMPARIRGRRAGAASRAAGARSVLAAESPFSPFGAAPASAPRPSRTVAGPSTAVVPVTAESVVVSPGVAESDLVVEAAASDVDPRDAWFGGITLGGAGTFRHAASWATSSLALSKRAPESTAVALANQPSKASGRVAPIRFAR